MNNLLNKLWPTLEAIPGEKTLLDSRQADCDRFEARSVKLPPELLLRFSVLSLMMKMDPVKNGPLFFIRGVCDKAQDEIIVFCKDEAEARKEMEGAYEYFLKQKAEQENRKELLLLLIG